MKATARTGFVLFWELHHDATTSPMRCSIHSQVPSVFEREDAQWKAVGTAGEARHTRGSDDTVQGQDTHTAQSHLAVAGRSTAKEYHSWRPAIAWGGQETGS